MKISVIMPCYLGDYANAASERPTKLLRAMASFMKQTHEDKELIVVSDGCEETNILFSRFVKACAQQYNYPSTKKLQLVFCSERKDDFSGHLRSIGIQNALGDIITYLDSDDVLLPDALANLANHYPDKCDWVYYDDYVAENKKLTQLRRRDNVLQFGRLGTSGFAHKRELNLKWPDGYGHDWQLIEELMKTTQYAKIPLTGYVVCHIPGQIDY